MLCNRDLGRMAESELQKWAAQCGIVDNKVGNDKTGWDFFLELHRPPLPPDAPRSLDHEPAATACIVQVKGTDYGTFTKIALDNLKRLVDWTIPAFLLIIKYEGGDDPQTAFLVHIDEELIERVLKRLREVPDEERDCLHEHKMSIAWNDMHEIKGKNGRSLREKIMNYAGADPVKYAKEKIKTKANVGYPKRPYTARLVIKTDGQEDVERKMVDFAIGLTDRLDASSMDWQETRFGITKPIPNKMENHKVSYIQINPLPIAGEANISFRSKSKNSVNFECNYYDPRIIFPIIEKDKLRFRFAAEYVNMVASTNGHWTFSFDMPALDENASLETTAKCAELLYMLENASNDEIEIDFSLNRGEVSKFHFDPSSLSSSITVSPELRDTYKAVRNAWKIAQFVDLPRGVKVRIGQLSRHAEKLELCRILLDPSYLSNLSLSGPIPGAPTGKLGYPAVSGGQIGNFLVIVAAAICGTPEYTGEQSPQGSIFVIKMPSVHVVEREVIPVVGEGELPVLPYYNRVLDWMKSKEIEILPEFNSLPGAT